MARTPQKKPIVAITLPTEGQLVRIINRGAHPGGHWRARVKHPKGQVDHQHDAFDAAQLEQLFADPKLDVRYVDAPPKKAE